MNRAMRSPITEEQIVPALHVVEDTMNRLMDAADVDRVFGDPIQNNGTTIIPVAEVVGGIGVGSGFGMGTMGKPRGRQKKIDTHGETQSETQGEAQGEPGQTPEEGAGGGGGGGRVHSRPVAVVVASGGDVRVEPLVDKTKVVLTAVIANTILEFMLLRLFRRG